MKSKAITKIQSIILIAVIVVSVGGCLVYFIWNEAPQKSSTIKIGILADLDMLRGERAMKAAILAAEHVNMDGGILGREIEIIGEDSDVEAVDVNPATAINALNRLITYHKVDFVITSGGINFVIDAGVEHKKILIGTVSPTEALTQRVIDDYDKYKYFFRVGTNETTVARDFAETVLYATNMTRFNKIGYLAIDIPQIGLMTTAIEDLAETHDVDVVYTGKYPWGTIDFSSYFSSAESAGVEIMVPITITQEGLVLVKEWYERQSPMVIWGMNAFAGIDSGWNATEGKVEHTAYSSALAVQFGYAATTKTLAMRDAFIERWGTVPNLSEITVYDCIRFLLVEALERAQTTETETVIKALEEVEVENSLEANFKFTSSHDHYFESGSESLVNGVFQWQSDGKMAIVYPKKIMEETGATFTYPLWTGPWEEK